MNRKRKFYLVLWRCWSTSPLLSAAGPARQGAFTSIGDVVYFRPVSARSVLHVTGSRCVPLTRNYYCSGRRQSRS
jgi:hypothetical protein